MLPLHIPSVSVLMRMIWLRGGPFINEVLQNRLVLYQNWLLPIVSADLFVMSRSGGSRMTQNHRSHHELPSLDAIQVRGCVCVNRC